MIDVHNPSGEDRKPHNGAEIPAAVKTENVVPAVENPDVPLSEPVLMPNQGEPFNGDHFVEKNFLLLKETFNIKSVVELGTCVGGSTFWLAKNFKKVDTLEIEKTYQDLAKKRCEGLTNITFHLGSTVDKLAEILDILDNDCLLFIDSHWGDHFPLFEELEIIKTSGLKPVMVIHDCKAPKEPNLGFDSYKGVDICFEAIKTHLDAIYGIGGYEFYYNSDAQSTAIKRGVIYIHPSI